jgi:mono/diheme cytochrome c family protein
MKNSVLIITILATTLFRLSAQTWDVPQDKKGKVSPFKFTTESAAKGQEIFKRNCLSCHGEPTKGNFQPLTPPPGDPATDKFQKQTDGELFYKIATGRGLMPTFKDIIPEEERWQIISYFRSFNKNYVQPDIASGSQASAAKQATLAITCNAAKKEITVLATDTSKKPIKGASLVLYVKRYFGNMAIGEPAITNEKGIATFIFPNDIRGDKHGEVEIIVKLNSDKGDDSQKSEKLAIGVPTDKPPLTKNRAMWNVGKKAPVWLLFSYTLVVVGIWSFITYIIYQLVKLKRARKGNS